jgi:hypothetical protein
MRLGERLVDAPGDCGSFSYSAAEPIFPYKAGPNEFAEPAPGLGGSSSLNNSAGSKFVAVGLSGAPEVSARTSASLMPLICSKSGTIAVSLLRSK